MEMTLPTKADPEGAVRLYLMYLRDPESLRDEAAIAKAQTAVDKAKDPIEELKARSALERAQVVNGDAFRAAFLTHAKDWAEANEISVSAFRDLGVPSADLVAAGLATGGSGRSSGTARRTVRGRAPRLSLDDVAAKLPKSEFRLSDLAEAIGREPATTRNYLNKLVENGDVAVVGDDPKHSGKGKPAKLYVKA